MEKRLPIWALALAAAAPATADNCDNFAERSARLDATGITFVEVLAGAGSLRVEGRDALTEIRAEGTACAARAAWLENIRIEARSQGDRAAIATVLPVGGEPGAGEARLDLVILVPSHATLDIRDSSGEMTVRNVGATDIVDSSGAISAEGVRGDLRVRDGSGEISVRQVTGNVHIRDSSGGIDVRGVRGSVTVEEDSSGGIEVEDVEGSVHVARDSSGGIAVSDIGGDFVVEHDGSGGISHERVAGRVQLPTDQ